MYEFAFRNEVQIVCGDGNQRYYIHSEKHKKACHSDKRVDFQNGLINLAAPRIKDFRGLNEKAFDRQGNYAMGLTEQGVFPEINMADAAFTHGMNINMCFSNSTPERSRFVLEQMGMPFRKPEKK
jgi:large subunit ribosomal protein L5